MKKNIFKISLWSILFLTLTSFTASNSQLQVEANSILFPEKEFCNISNTTFKGGEELVYKVYYNWNFVWLSAGEVKFKVKDLGKNFLITCTGTTYKSYEWFFKVRDVYTVVVDKKTLLPISSVRNVKEGGFTVYDKMIWDQKNLHIKSLRGRTKEKAKWLEYDVENCMHDILSVIYYARNLDFNQMRAGETFPVEMFMDKEVFRLKSVYHGKEVKEIKGWGTHKTHRVEPKLVIGDVFKESNMQTWVSDDNNHVPFQIETPLSVGSAKIILKSYKGLRHTLDSKVDAD